MRLRIPILIIAVLLVAAVCGYADDAATTATPVVAADPADTAAQVVTWIASFIPEKYLALYGAILALATLLGAMLTGTAKLIRTVRGDDNRAAAVIDAIAHWCSVLGTSTRKSQITPAAPIVAKS